MAGQRFTGFDSQLFRFLRQLQRNNNREWFARHKPEYESTVLSPALRFVEAFQGPLRRISPFFQAVPKRMGGSVMRVYRDTRFSKDKKPYKTNLGIQFRHELARDVHAPGFYVHLEPEQCFLGVGLWRPASDSLRKIRAAIDEDGARWKRSRNSRPFRTRFELAGEQLKRPPRGIDNAHPLVDDLKRKDFIGVARMTERDLLRKTVVKDIAEAFSASRPWMRFLCQAVEVPF